MRDVLALSAADILGIPPTAPERLFTGAADAARAEYRRLALRWHPDRNPGDPGAARVLAHVNVLYALAGRKLATGAWNVPNLLELRLAGGRTYRRAYRRRRAFELGELYVGDVTATWVLRGEFADLFANARRRIAALPPGPPAMREECARSMPVVERVLDGADGPALVAAKTPDALLLRDVLEHFGGRLDPRHVAWIVSTMMAMACYLSYARVGHNAIGPDTLFVSPRFHAGVLIGGWWYAAPFGEPLAAAPDRTVEQVPAALVRARRADPRIDLELVRATGRELLGDASGASLGRAGAVPRPMADWLRLPSSGDAVEDYRRWERAREASFGERRFVPLGLTATDLYPD